MSKSRLSAQLSGNSFIGSIEKLVTLKFPPVTQTVLENFVATKSTIIFPTLEELDFPYKWLPTGVAASYEGFRSTFPNVKRVVAS